MELVSCPTCHAVVEPTVPSCPLCGTALTGAAPRSAPISAPAPLPAWGSPVAPPPAWGSPVAPPPVVPVPVAPPPVALPPVALPPVVAVRSPVRHRSRARLLLPLLVVIALGAAAITWWTTRSDGAGGWTAATTASGRFRLELPGEPQRTTETVDVAGQRLVVDLLTVGDLGLDQVAAGAMFLEVDVSADPAISQLATDPGLAPSLLYAQAGTVFSTAGMVLGPMEPATSTLGPAIRVSGTVTGQDLIARGWMVGTDGAVLAALVIEPAADVSTAETTRDRVVASVAPA